MRNDFNSYFRSEIALIIYLALGGMGVGSLFGYPLGGTIFGLLVYIGQTLSQIYRLDRWIETKQERDAPEVSGIFGHFLDESLRQKKKHKRNHNI